MWFYDSEERTSERTKRKRKTKASNVVTYDDYKTAIQFIDTVAEGNIEKAKDILELVKKAGSIDELTNTIGHWETLVNVTGNAETALKSLETMKSAKSLI